MKTRKLNSKVMKAAWTIYRKYKKQTLENWSKALKKAWKWAKETIINRGIRVNGFLKETEKAILVSANLVCCITDQSVAANFWCPKSIINDNCIPSWFLTKKEEELASNHSYSGKLRLVFN